MKSMKWLLLICSALIFLAGCKEDNTDPVVFQAPDEAPSQDEVPSSPSESETVPVEEVSSASFDGAVQHVERLSDGSLVVMGAFTQYGDDAVTGLAKLNPDRSLSGNFSGNLRQVSGQVFGMERLDGDSLALYGRDVSLNGGGAAPAVIVDSDGLVNERFLTAMTGYQGQVNDLKQDKNGNLHLVGEFESSSEPVVKNIMVVNLAGNLVNSYE